MLIMVIKFWMELQVSGLKMDNSKAVEYKDGSLEWNIDCNLFGK